MSSQIGSVQAFYYYFPSNIRLVKSLNELPYARTADIKYRPGYPDSRTSIPMGKS